MPLWLVVLLLLWRRAAGVAQAPTWPDGAALTTSGLGLGSVLVSWPAADNNGFELIGYYVDFAVFDSNNAAPPQTRVFSSLGRPALRQYVVSGLTPGQSYNLYVTAVTTAGILQYESDQLMRTYVVSSPVGVDPTTVAAVSFSVTSGAPHTLTIAAKQPSTGQDQTVGPVCLETQSASCVPGRIFVAFLQPVCQLVDFDSTCAPLTESDPGFDSAVMANTGGYSGKVSVGYDEWNGGDYSVALLGTQAGEFSLAVQAVTPNQVLGMYWDNANFIGEAVDTRTDPMIDFDWGTGPVVLWATEYVSARWLGFLKPDATANYALRCVATTRCDLWLNDEHVIVSTAAGCASGCPSSQTLRLERSAFYKIRIDFVSGTGSSKISLQWKDDNGLFPAFTAIPSSVYQRGAYITGSPKAVSVRPGSAVALKSQVYGSEEGIFRPVVGKVYTVYVQVNDAFGNACADFSPQVRVLVKRADFDSLPVVTVVGQPLDPTALDGVYVAQVVYATAGEFELHAAVNGERVGNSPLHQIVTSGSFAGVSLGSTRIVIDPAEPQVDTDFTVTVEAVDMFGNPLVAGLAGSDIKYTLQRSWEPVASIQGCGSRTNETWLIGCWNGEFLFVDDALVNAQIFPHFSSGLLSPASLRSHYAGPHLLVLQVGDELLTGAPIVVTVKPSGKGVEATKSLVLWQTGDQITVFDSDVTALVLLRDAAGNILSDRAGELVQLEFRPTGSPSRLETCEYVAGKYYACSSYADTVAETTISVLVNGVIARVAEGSPPETAACVDVPICGSPACPCAQQLVPASFTVDVVA